MNDNDFNEVSNPAHYCKGRKYEPKDVIRDWDLNFNLGNAVNISLAPEEKVAKAV